MVLFIVAREQQARYQELAGQCAGHDDVQVILDRRYDQRRRRSLPYAFERRRHERRANPQLDVELGASGWALVRVGAETPPAAPAADPESGKRLLVIDDDARITELVRIAFRRSYVVETASDGVLGLAKIVLRPPDLVLLDLSMPGVDGLVVLKCIRQLDESLPVIVITGNEDVALAAESLRHGVFSYVPKPFDLQALHHLVAVILGARA